MCHVFLHFQQDSRHLDRLLDRLIVLLLLEFFDLLFPVLIILSELLVHSIYLKFKCCDAYIAFEVAAQKAAKVFDTSTCRVYFVAHALDQGHNLVRIFVQLGLEIVDALGVGGRTLHHVA